MEIWKELKGYSINYLISNTGKIKSPDQTVDIGMGRIQFKKERIIKCHVSNRGYWAVGLTCEKGKSKVFHLHRLLAQTFIPNPNEYKCINHKDGNKLNNHISNLEWVTHSQNNKHAYDTGLKKPCRKITTEHVVQIRALSRHLGVRHFQLAAMYNAKPSAISEIVNYKLRING